MKVYLAGERLGTAITPGHPPPLWLRYAKRRLFSYYYHRLSGSSASTEIHGSYKLGLDLFLDSGAYTAYTQQVTINLEDYAYFINKNANLFTAISCLDDTNKKESVSYDNQKALESMGCKVQPVFHAREDPAWLIKYLDEGYDYIFIGGMVPETARWLTEWLDNLFAKYLVHSDGTPRVKLHGFGLTDQKLMFRYPWYSVDSTSWLMKGIFGECSFLDKETGLLVKIVMSEDSPQARNWKGWHYRNLTPDQQAKVDAWLAQAGVTAEQCATHYSFRDVVNAHTYQNLEELGTSIFRPTQEGLF